MLEVIVMQWLVIRRAALPDLSIRQCRDGEFGMKGDYVTPNETVVPEDDETI